MSKKNSLSVVEEYIQYEEQYGKIYGHNNVVVIYECGMFYEMYSLTNDKLNRIGEITNLMVTKKDKSNPTISTSNCYLCGFPKITSAKFIKILIDNGFTIVEVSQTTPPPNPQRAITNIYSPGTYIDEISNPENNYLASLYIEEITNNIFMCGAGITDVSTGKLLVFQSLSEYGDEIVALDELAKLMQSYNAKEIIVTTNNVTSYDKYKLLSYLEIAHRLTNIQTLQELMAQKGNKMIDKISYHEEQFKMIYHKTICDFNLEGYTHGRIALAILYNYISAHNQNLLKNIGEPTLLEKQTNLHMDNNALYQLNIFNNDEKNVSNMFYNNGSSVKCLFDIINQTCTTMGRRYLKTQLINPLTDKTLIEARYTLIDDFILGGMTKNNDELLKMIPDIERFARKVAIGNIHPLDMLNFINGLKYAYDMINKVNVTIDTSLSIKKNTLLTNMYEMFAYFDDIFDYNELGKYFINDITGSIFKIGLFPNIDQLIEDKRLSHDYIYLLCDSFNKLLNDLNGKTVKKTVKKNMLNSIDVDTSDENLETLVKVEYNERDKYHLLLTKRRAEVLQNYFIGEERSIKVHNLTLTKNDFSFNMNPKGNTCKIFIPDIQERSIRMAEIDDRLRLLIKNQYVNTLTSIYTTYKITIKQTIELVSYIDFINSGAKVACLNKYCKPMIQNVHNDKSYVNGVEMRHAIAEKLLIDSTYVPISINLGDGDEQDGILLFGLNSVGKSTLQKSIGINIILAQIGYYVPAKTFIYFPYRSLMTRITSNDNIFKGLSSFALEISELRAILKRSNQNSLIIADEVCKGTEHQSSLIIVMAMLETLSNRKCSFITATHLHDICSFPRLHNLKNVKMYHLHVDYNEKANVIKYNRQLLEGSGSPFYGLFVAKYLINDQEFLNLTNNIKVEMYPELIVSDKISKYNKNLFVSRCMICSYTPNKNTDKPLETHHIIFQKDADEFGYLENSHVHKNHKNNLCTLCAACHDEVDRCNITIYGYEANGKLSYDTVDTIKEKMADCNNIMLKLKERAINM